LTACPSCGRELPLGALFCPDCGVPTANFGQATLTPSHFNSGTTSTSPLQAQAGGGFAYQPPARPDEVRRPSHGARRAVALAIIAVLAFLLVATTFEGGLLSSGGPLAGAAINSASDPMTGEQLSSAYFSGGSQAAYANKTVYVQDSLDSGVLQSPGGQPYSSIASQTVFLFWSSQAQSWFGQLIPGAVVLARCAIQGPAQNVASLSPSVVLTACAVISVNSQASTGSATVSENND
jgi:hypothetical protein